MEDPKRDVWNCPGTSLQAGVSWYLEDPMREISGHPCKLGWLDSLTPGASSLTPGMSRQAEVSQCPEHPDGDIWGQSWNILARLGDLDREVQSHGTSLMGSSGHQVILVYRDVQGLSCNTNCLVDNLTGVFLMSSFCVVRESSYPSNAKSSSWSVTWSSNCSSAVWSLNFSSAPSTTELTLALDPWTALVHLLPAS